ncbi:CPXCG motif-containing cysteine-rich protein [Salinisphaera sp. Q1T1-3]|uniref:CPXCG motif-containing cysteine-rich protein n=1 Tax=Salinisphaera sp. Q1T1-3 TaxID=2321229 RepID=UPI000E71B686|nr:CPXCG motif-containing cysteine-rich protein [Salinisphaera sp. Q1T1-3]RJS94317.1 CPXCG motif-containing cysteine-rich protein [Salinisphaera sp. Q1T1-3]
MIDEPSVACPYCGETITIVVDTTAGRQSYVEDCFVCCQPIVLDIDVDPDGALAHVDARPENG